MMRRLSARQKHEKYNAIMENVSKIVKRRLDESSYDEDDESEYEFDYDGGTPYSVKRSKFADSKREYENEIDRAEKVDYDGDTPYWAKLSGFASAETMVDNEYDDDCLDVDEEDEDEDEYAYSDLTTSKYSDMTPAQKFNAAKKFFEDRKLSYTMECVASRLFPYAQRDERKRDGKINVQIEVRCIADDDRWMMQLFNYRGGSLKNLGNQDFAYGSFYVIPNEDNENHDVLEITVWIPKTVNRSIYNEIRTRYNRKKSGLNDKHNSSYFGQLNLSLVLDNLSFDEIMDEIDELRSNLDYLVAMSRNANK